MTNKNKCIQQVAFSPLYVSGTVIDFGNIAIKKREKVSEDGQLIEIQAMLRDMKNNKMR